MLEAQRITHEDTASLGPQACVLPTVVAVQLSGC